MTTLPVPMQVFKDISEKLVVSEILIDSGTFKHIANFRFKMTCLKLAFIKMSEKFEKVLIQILLLQI